jgi:hypothetical protein
LEALQRASAMRNSEVAVQWRITAKERSVLALVIENQEAFRRNLEGDASG